MLVGEPEKHAQPNSPELSRTKEQPPHIYFLAKQLLMQRHFQSIPSEGAPRDNALPVFHLLILNTKLFFFLPAKMGFSGKSPESVCDKQATEKTTG